MSVDLDFGGRAFRVQTAHGDEETIVSQHTGRELRRLSGQVVIGNEEEEERFAEAREAFEGKAVPEVGAGRSWLVTERSSQSRTTGTSGRTTYLHELTLQEYESHIPDQLALPGLVLEPYTYEEEVDDHGTMRIDAKVSLKAAEAEALRQLILTSGYFEVRRVGLSDTRRRMRFGQVFWSRHGDLTKYALVLVDESQDSGPWAKTFAFDEDRAVRSAVAYHIGVINALQDLLVSKGVATSEEIEKIKEKASSQVAKNNHRFFEVEDVDAG
jgi:hypothetical protein